MRWPFVLALTVAAGLAPICQGDEFDSLQGPVLREMYERAQDAPDHDLDVAQISAAPAVLAETRSGLLLVRTSEGNLAALLPIPALRKGSDPTAEPVTVLVLERFATFEAPACRDRLAAGSGVILFEGFSFDLDTGQVVPEGFGADIQFIKGEDDPLGSLKVSPSCEVRTGIVPLRQLSSPPAGPSPGKSVVPSDFAGLYHLEANGQWSGRLELQVRDGTGLAGQFRSDQTGRSYPVTGQVGVLSSEHVIFAVDLPRTRLEFDGRLWTQGKGALAGTASLLDRTYGFYALRQTAAAPVTENPDPIRPETDQ